YAARLSGDALGRRVVEQVVGELERHAELFAVPPQRRAMPRRAAQRADLARGAEQRRGLRAIEREVIVLRKTERVVRRELAHLAERHLVRRRRKGAQRLEIAEGAELPAGARRTFEWSTESSCTTLARCTSSATAAIATARGSERSSRALESSSSVGRSILPFIPIRCALTAAMIGASAFTMGHSSPLTRPSCPR